MLSRLSGRSLLVSPWRRAGLPHLRTDGIIRDPFIPAEPRMAGDNKDSVDPRRFSRRVVDGVERTPSRAMLRAVGFKTADFAKPQVGIASTWSMVTPCNMHIDGLARESAAGVD